MAAIVRSGARRLAGSALLQRAPAADGLIQRTQASGSGPFLARFMSSTKQHDSAPSKAADKIEVMKEELYDMISVVEYSPLTDSANKQLFKFLSAQIKPRPDDSQWLLARESKRRSDVMRRVATISGLCLGSVSYFVMDRLEGFPQSYIEEGKQVEASNEEVTPV